MKASGHRHTSTLFPRGVEVNGGAQEMQWSAVRKPGDETYFLLGAGTFSWLLGLPKAVRPMQLSWQFPRISNHFAEAWGNREACFEYFDELLESKRPGRRGFPVEIFAELAVLKKYFTGLKS